MGSIGGWIYGPLPRTGSMARYIVPSKGILFRHREESKGRNLFIVLSILVLRRLTATGRTREERRNKDKF